MTTDTTRRLGWGIWAASLMIALVAVVFLWLSWREPLPPGSFGFRGFSLLFVGVFGVVGYLIASRRPENPIGWLFLAGAVFSAVQELAQDYALFSYARGGLPLGVFAAWIPAWEWVPGTGIMLFALLLFPNGHLLSRRWRWAVWLGIAGIVIGSVGLAIQPGPIENFTTIENPIGVGGESARAVISGVGLLPYGILFIAAAFSLVIRYRRSAGEERQQMKWLVASGLFVALALPISFVAQFASPSPTAYLWVSVLVILAFASVPVAIGIAILRYRLYDVDVVIKKTVVFGIITVFVMAVFLAAVALTLGGILGGLVIAILFRPVRDAARRIADRLVYGKRATPYEALNEFSGRIGETYATEDVLPRMAQILREATGAEAAHVWLASEDGLRLVASAPDDARPDGPPEGSTFDVVHQGERLGALSVAMPANDPLDRTREDLVRDLGAQAGLLLRNVQLVEDLRASRLRLVTATDEARRRLERNIHDGAQQQLVALAVKAKLARSVVDVDAARAGEMLAEMQSELAQAIDDLRDLARGIYPPSLADRGLAAALEAQARKTTLPVSVEADGIGRFSQEIEAAVYFSCLEAMQNVAKYAEATRVTIWLDHSGGTLGFAVTDDGRGFDPTQVARGTGLQGMADRLAAVGGELTVTSALGRGTTVNGTIPIEARS
jgi:signal transduction histidine kinase